MGVLLILWRFSILLLAMAIGMLYKNISDLIQDMPIPELPLNQWWGDTEPPTDWSIYLSNSSEIINNRIMYPPNVIDDLEEKLYRTTSFTEPLEGSNFEYGFNTNYLKELLNYWHDNYLPRWHERQLFLWQFNHFTTEIQGLRMHFLHLKVYEEHTVEKRNYPVLLLHGWPGSIREFYTIIHKLHNPTNDLRQKYVFNVVAPSLPGFAWSQGTSKRGLGPAQIAVILHNLMLRLGYNEYFIQGGDWGAVIGSHIATLFPQHVLGYHSNFCTVMTAKSMLKQLIINLLPSLFLPKNFEDFLPPLTTYIQQLVEESGYYHLQSTKPDTIGIVLQQNPVGLAAYILEKFSTWTNPSNKYLPNGGLNLTYEMDALLDNIMIYYLTESIITSQRIYREHNSMAQRNLYLDRVPTMVPTGCARFKNELMHFTDFQLKDKYLNLIHSTFYKVGGHFAAFELPDILYEDFIDFVQKVEKFSNTSQSTN